MVFQTQVPISLVILVIGIQDLYTSKYKYTIIIIIVHVLVYIEKRYMTIKVHQLLHLVDSVRCLGPLWAHSCFPFESLNGRIKRMFHGTCSPHLQVHIVITQIIIMIIYTYCHSRTTIPGNITSSLPRIVTSVKHVRAVKLRRDSAASFKFWRWPPSPKTKAYS